MATRKLRTNEDFVRDLMNYSQHGAMMQMFVMTALEKYAQQVRDAGPKIFDSDFLSGEAWHGTAQELLRRLDEFQGRN